MQRIDQKIFSFDINRTVDEVTFHNWKEMVAATANPEDKYTVQTRLIEKQPVFKVAYDQYIQVMNRSKNFSKHIRIPLGDETKTLLHLLCHEIRCLYDVPDRSALIDSAQGKCDDLLLNYQTLRDLREITPDCFALLCEGTFPFATVLCTTCCIATFPGGPTASCGSACWKFSPSKLTPTKSAQF